MEATLWVIIAGGMDWVAANDWAFVSPAGQQHRQQQHLGKDAWRNAASNYRSVPGAVEYLGFLDANGYPLSPIEQVVTGDRR